MAATTIATTTRTPRNAKTRPIVSPTAEPELPPPPAVLAGTQAIPVHRQSPSGESAGLHSAPSHHQKASAEKRVSGGGGDPPCGPTMTPSIGSTSGGERRALALPGPAASRGESPLKSRRRTTSRIRKAVKGVILAGGTGSRLHPLTLITNKHLLPLYDRPMISYAIEAMVRAGVSEMMLVTGGTHAGEFLRLLGNGHEFGIERLFYAYQERPGGIAEALSLAERFVDGDRVMVMLGDNIFEWSLKGCVDAFAKQALGARVVLTHEADREHLRHLGVAHLNSARRIEHIVEKPDEPPSEFAVTGVYFYDETVWRVLGELKPSGRGELEITDVNNWYLDHDLIEYDIVQGFWGDAGESMQAYYQVQDFVRANGVNRER
jgi:glucose-1-phosphate thymidylyltransferase